MPEDAANLLLRRTVDNTSISRYEVILMMVDLHLSACNCLCLVRRPWQLVPAAKASAFPFILRGAPGATLGTHKYMAVTSLRPRGPRHMPSSSQVLLGRY